MSTRRRLITSPNPSPAELAGDTVITLAEGAGTIYPVSPGNADAGITDREP
jgi:hypothetical protein